MENEGKKNENAKKLIDLREKSGMSRKEFCEYFEIPYRTVQDWELGNRSMPDYLLRLMAYRIEMEGIYKKRKGDGEDEKKK